MLYGYIGKILRVDLDREELKVEPLDVSLTRKWIGGVGFGSLVLYKESPPSVRWDDPENPLIFATGPFNGTSIAGSGAIAVVTKGPLTNGAASSQANGFFGVYLKFSGFDAIIVKGRARRWLYLHIENGNASLCEANHLIGSDTWETEDRIKAELGQSERGMTVYSIGPAGENLVKFAAIVGDRGHVAGHNGIGAVMGSKRLKAIAVGRGSLRPAIKDKELLSSVTHQLADNFKKAEAYQWGTSMLFPQAAKGGFLPVKNLTTNIFPEYERFTGEYYRSRAEIKLSPCWACSAHHSHIIKIPEGKYAGYVAEEPEYETMAGFGPLIGQTDPWAAIMLHGTTDRLGLEGNETGWLMGLVMECYEKGIISKKDTDGLEMTWGNVDAVRQLLFRIAHRQGFGNVLAEGVMRAAQQIGSQAVDMAVYVRKGHAPRGHDHRARWTEMHDTATSNAGTLETGPTVPKNIFSPEEVSTLNATEKGQRSFVDSLVVCTSPTGTYRTTGLDLVVSAVNAITGWDMTSAEAKTMGERIVNLMKVYNLRHGLGRDVDAPSDRYWSTPVDGPAQGKTIRPYWDQMIDNYYVHMGWDQQTGKPLPETLKKLGLAEIIPDIWTS